MKPKTKTHLALILPILAATALPLSSSQAQQAVQNSTQKSLNLKTDAANDFELDAHQAEDMKAGMNTLSVTLDTALSNLPRWDTEQADKELTRTFATLLGQAETQRRDTLFYTALKHGDLIGQVLAQTEEPGAVGIIDAKVENLWQTLEFAKKYGQFDLERANQALDGKKDENFDLHYARFGYDYNRFATELVDSVVNARAQFVLTYMAVGWLGKAIEHDKVEAGPLAVATYQLAKAQNYLRAFYQQAITQPAGIPSHHYIAATKELRWRIQAALKEFEKRPEIQAAVQALKKTENPVRASASVSVSASVAAPEVHRESFLLNWKHSTQEQFLYVLNAIVNHVDRVSRSSYYQDEHDFYSYVYTFCNSIVERGSPLGACLNDEVIEKIRAEALMRLSQVTDDPDTFRVYKSILSKALAYSKERNVQEWTKDAEMRRIRQEVGSGK